MFWKRAAWVFLWWSLLMKYCGIKELKNYCGFCGGSLNVHSIFVVKPCGKRVIVVSLVPFCYHKMAERMNTSFWKKREDELKSFEIKWYTQNVNRSKDIDYSMGGKLDNSIEKITGNPGWKSPSDCWSPYWLLPQRNWKDVLRPTQKRSFNWHGTSSIFFVYAKPHIQLLQFNDCWIRWGNS